MSEDDYDLTSWSPGIDYPEAVHAAEHAMRPLVQGLWAELGSISAICTVSGCSEAIVKKAIDAAHE